MKIKRDENKKISCTPPGKISNIIFEKKNTTQAKVKIGIKITLYIVIATFLATVIGFTLIGDLDYLRQNSLGNFLYLIAQILETNSAIQESIETPKKQNKASNEHNKDIIDELIKDIDIIKNKLSEYT